METAGHSNMCRCCASEGAFKDIKSTYHWMGEEEIYADMLKDCFDINLNVSEHGEDGGICEVCITQLRNAINFKKQVQHTEEQFKKHLQNKTLFRPHIVKVEVAAEEDSEEGDIMGSGDDAFSGAEFEVPIKTEDDEPKPKKRSKAPATSTRSKKSKSDDGEPSTKRMDEDGPKRRKRKKNSDESATPERVEHRVNLTAILQYSNASPFRDKTIRGFSCLYCAKAFPDIQSLREHTAQQSEKDKINTIIDYKLSYNPIKVDITNLHCTVCNLEMRDLNDLKDHLVAVHNKTIYKHIKDIILPFRLEDGHNFTCVICSVVHISFKNLYHHMSSHYRNYCCKKCGAGYITIAALRKHGKTHAQGIFPCDFCDKSYTSMTKKRNHEKGVHTGGWLRNKCPHCPEVFVSYYDRSEHLVKVHNQTPIIYPCNACNKTYKKKFELNRHIKHHHLQQRSYLCDKCNAKFFSKRGLSDHLSRHSGGVVCSCDVCGKTFSRTRTLKEHLKIHEDDKRFQCEICHKTFMQKCSLKSHVRLHQDDLDIFKEFDDVKHLIDNRELTLKQIAAESKIKAQAEKAKEEREFE
ncbi:zinc finger protein 761 isoform X1 [Spodoptera frugiperda]|uniref:Zinc finger protein 761 isoform X1 n=1 Tax=Spodoptera frugiperda TaxID=7108 RepID=A0A9R0E596_SPOFR|nr:zinc finger protein 761 isoform X1 [Spodoptera frugiperda]